MSQWMSVVALGPMLAAALVGRASLPTSRARPVLATASDSNQLVWLTGDADLRVHDHGGFTAAAEANGTVIPLFIVDPEVHLRYPAARLTRLQRALTSLEATLRSSYDLTLVVRSGRAEEVLPSFADEIGASACHVVRDGPETAMRTAQSTGCAALTAAGVSVERWKGTLRSSDRASGIPGFFPDYCAAIHDQPLHAPVEAPATGELVCPEEPIPSDGVPSLASLLASADSVRPAAVQAATSDTAQPHEELALELCDENAARSALQSYVRDGRDEFADARLARALPSGTTETSSLHAAAGQRLLDGEWKPSQALSLREAPTRAFSAALALGTISAREVRNVAAIAGAHPHTSLLDMPLWGRSSIEALADVVEWREWFEVLAQRSLGRQADGKAGTSGGEKAQAGDPREGGQVEYWRWSGQHLVRYISWAAGKDFDGSTPAMLFVHGFAASAEQWERMVYSLRKQSAAANGGKDVLPPIYAMDLVGFGHSSKPDLSYTQYVWESQIVDFVHDVMGSACEACNGLVLGGNSIGGGLSAGASATLGSLVKGVVLCNTAGVLLEPKDYDATTSVRDATLAGKSAKAYSPIPLLGPPALELFGAGIINLIYPQIGARLATIYEDRTQNVDPALTFAIQQGAKSPGSPNVIGSGQKLSENRPLNEVLSSRYGFGGPVLMVQGQNDRVSGAKRAQDRADQFERLRDGVDVARVDDGGHCVQDDAPDATARALLEWLPKVRAYAADTR